MGFCPQPCCCLQYKATKAKNRNTLNYFRQTNQESNIPNRKHTPEGVLVQVERIGERKTETETNPIFFINNSFTGNKSTKIPFFQSTIFLISKL